MNKAMCLLLFLLPGSQLSAQTDTSQRAFNLSPSHQVKFSGYLQVRAQAFMEEDVADYMDIRRARLDARGSVNSKWSYRLQFDAAGNPKLLDGFVLFKPFSFLEVQAGQYKLPFSRNNLISSASLDFADRSLIVEQASSRNGDVNGNNNGRDIGLQLSGKFVKLRESNLIEISAGVFNGNGINVNDNNDYKDLCGRLILSPLQGLEAGISYYDGKRKGTEGNEVRKRQGAELSYIYKFASVSGEYIIAEDGAGEKEGMYLQIGSYIYKRKLQLVCRYDFLETERDQDNNELIYITGGINYYINQNAKAVLNYTGRNETGPFVRNDHIAAMVQVSF